MWYDEGVININFEYDKVGNMSEIKCYLREDHIKVYKYRRRGYVPAILYGNGISKPISIYCDERLLVELLWANEQGSIVDLDVEGEKYRAVIQAVQLYEETGKLDHVDFMIH